MTTEPQAQQIVLEEDEATLVPAELALLSLLEGHGPQKCGCVNEHDQPLVLQVKLGETEGPSGTQFGAKRLAAVWEHINGGGEPHWRREVPI